MKLETYFKQAQLLHFKKGDIILCPDDPSTEVYFIEKGHVRVYSLTEWGDEKLFVIYKTGEFFPLFWLFDNVPLTRFYEALDNVSVWKAAKSDFVKQLQANQEMFFELTKKIVAVVDILVGRIDSLEFTNASARLISRLWYLAQRFGEKRGEKIIINVPISHKDIASSVGLTRETISREFEKLEKKGIVRYVRHFIVINDMERLKKEMALHYEKKLL